MSERIGTKSDDFVILKILKISEYENKFYEMILYGFVAKVKSKLNNKIYAIKKIDLSLVKNEKKIKYYKNELDIIRRFEFKHENIYRPVSYFKEKNVIYIITEYIEGQNLLDLLKWHKKNKMQIEEKRIEKIFDQCLRGLNYIHKKGIIHRSIKLNNIIIDSNDRVKIINFKYAIEKIRNDNEKIQIGIFTAPEIKEGKYNEKVDVFSLGIVFNSLMYFSNRLPNGRGNYSDYLYHLIMKMTERDKTKRLSSEEIYLLFKNNYYNLMRACLKCFVFLLQDAILRLEISGLKEYEKIIELAKKIKQQEKTNIDELSKEFEEGFFENGFSLNDISPTNFTYYILSKFRNQDLLTDISYNLQIFRECYKCKNQIISNENHFIINFNVEQIERSRGNIKNIFKEFIKNKNTNSFREECTYCKSPIKFETRTKFFNLPKYFIIFIENGYRFSEFNEGNLDNFELGKEEGFDNKYSYQLNSIISKENENYDSYNRDEFVFTKNEEHSRNYILKEICRKDIIGLYYYQTNNNNNDENLNKPSTSSSSIINEYSLKIFLRIIKQENK